MPCDHRFLEQHLDQILTDDLSEQLQVQLEDCLSQCSECRHTLEQMRCFHDFSQHWQQQAPPEWNRRLFPVRNIQHSTRWWHWGSLATSVCALVLVMLNTTITTENGFSITLGQATTEDSLTDIEYKIARAQEDFLQIAETLLKDFVSQQNEQQFYALNAVLDQSRQERNDELNLLYTTWMEQRNSDQQFINERFNLIMDQQIDSNQYLNDLARSVSSTTQR